MNQIPNIEEVGDVIVAREAGENEWESGRFSTEHPIGTIYRKHENKPGHPTQFKFVWSIENSNDWPLTEREVRFFLETGYFSHYHSELDQDKK